jgi:hypothetical protein
VHLTSNDGVAWSEEADGGSIAFVGDRDVPWRGEVGQPSVARVANGSFVMAFVGRDAESSVARLGLATSDDAKTWILPDEPLAFVGGDALAFERDGVASPVVVRRGDALHLWYTGTSGARAAIGYAVGFRASGGQWAFERLGPVLEPEHTWEASRVEAPAVAVLPDPGGSADTATLHLWYQGGPPGRGRIGLATRSMPARALDAADYYGPGR